MVMESANAFLSSLDNFALDVFERVSDYIFMGDSEGIETSFLKRLIDLKRDASKVVWQHVDSFGKKAGSAGKEHDITWYLTGLSASLIWEMQDRRDLKNQRNTIVEIGSLAEKLKSKILGTNQGLVTEFLSWWAKDFAAQELEYSAFVSNPKRALSSALAWYRHREDRPKFPKAELVYRLATLQMAVEAFKKDPNVISVCRIGLKSQKRNPFTYFVINNHLKLEEIFGTSKHKLNAAIASILFERPVTSAQVEEIIFGARKRGEISSPKRKKPPRT